MWAEQPKLEVKVNLLSYVVPAAVGLALVALPEVSFANPVSGDAVARCKGLYSYLVTTQRNNDDLINKEVWPNKLVYWSTVAVQRSGEGKSQPGSEKSKQKIADMVGSFDAKTTVGRATTISYLEGLTDSCETLEKQIGQISFDSEKVASPAGENSSPSPTALTFDQALNCAKFYLVSANASEPAEKKRLGDIGVRWAALAEARKNPGQPTNIRIGYLAEVQKIKKLSEDTAALDNYIQERFSSCRKLQTENAVEFGEVKLTK